MKPKPDASLEVIRAIRRRMDKEFGDDPHKAGAYYCCRKHLTAAKSTVSRGAILYENQ
jgi:hypothetical protein